LAIGGEGADKFAKIFGDKGTFLQERQSPRMFGQHPSQWRERICAMRASPLLSLASAFASVQCGRGRVGVLTR
jgi:hypothetical protein